METTHWGTALLHTATMLASPPYLASSPSISELGGVAPPSILARWRAALLVLPALFYAIAAALSLVARRGPDGGPNHWEPFGAWRLAHGAAALAVCASLLSVGVLFFAGSGILRGPTLVSFGKVGALGFSLRSDWLGCLMLLLVSFIGWVIVLFSQRYLEGQSSQLRYIRCLMLTLAAVATLVVTNNLGSLAVAWIATSLALHGLLTFFRHRPQALIAAHKKFLASRLGDLFMLAGVGCIGWSYGTLEIDRAIAAAQNLFAQVNLGAQMPDLAMAAALCLAVSALLKCAQLPVHGWLIQVMEAPTPVSALLHAGVVNLGGFMLLRVGILVAGVPSAQTLLVVVGSTTAVIAALVMMTRISIKVSLAWSTCAQMGFMLMQCGLGLHELALLHLLAHSFYKAHAFLTAGTAVAQIRVKHLTPPAPAIASCTLGAAAIAGVTLVAAAAWAWGLSPALLSEEPALWVVGVIVALALVPLLTGPLLQTGAVGALVGAAAGLGIALVYFALHALFAGWLGLSTAGVAPAASTFSIAWALCCFIGLFLVQSAVRASPNGLTARTLHPVLFWGLYMDELFTKWTFRLWPAAVPPAQAAKSAHIAAKPRR